MTETIIKVRVAEYKTGSSPTIFKCFGLGSCVGVSLYDPRIRLGGMAHILLPSYKPRPGASADALPKSPFKFADLCLKSMFEKLLSLGCEKERLVAKMAGGANMFSNSFMNLPESPVQAGIGERNVLAAKDVLGQIGIPVLAEDVGGQKGRTLQFDTRTGSILITSTRGDSNVI